MRVVYNLSTRRRPSTPHSVHTACTRRAHSVLHSTHTHTHTHTHIYTHKTITHVSHLHNHHTRLTPFRLWDTAVDDDDSSDNTSHDDGEDMFMPLEPLRVPKRLMSLIEVQAIAAKGQSLLAVAHEPPTQPVATQPVATQEAVSNRVAQEQQRLALFRPSRLQSFRSTGDEMLERQMSARARVSPEQRQASAEPRLAAVDEDGRFDNPMFVRSKRATSRSSSSRRQQPSVDEANIDDWRAELTAARVVGGGKQSRLQSRQSSGDEMLERQMSARARANPGQWGTAEPRLAAVNEDERQFDNPMRRAAEDGRHGRGGRGAAQSRQNVSALRRGTWTTGYRSAKTAEMTHQQGATKSRVQRQAHSSLGQSMMSSSSSSIQPPKGTTVDQADIDDWMAELKAARVDGGKPSRLQSFKSSGDEMLERQMSARARVNPGQWGVGGGGPGSHMHQVPGDVQFRSNPMRSTTIQEHFIPGSDGHLARAGSSFDEPGLARLAFAADPSANERMQDAAGAKFGRIKHRAVSERDDATLGAEMANMRMQVNSQAGHGRRRAVPSVVGGMGSLAGFDNPMRKLQQSKHASLRQPHPSSSKTMETVETVETVKRVQGQERAGQGRFHQYSKWDRWANQQTEEEEEGGVGEKGAGRAADGTVQGHFRLKAMAAHGDPRAIAMLKQLASSSA